jgi:Rieske Fe-S protein
MGCNVLRGGPAWHESDIALKFTAEPPETDQGVRYGVIECPCHGSRFDLLTGAVLRSPAGSPLARFKTKVEMVGVGDAAEPHVFVAIDPEAVGPIA